MPNDPARMNLLIAQRGRRGTVAYDAKDPGSASPPSKTLRPPQGAPNVLLILPDDRGFGALSALEGACSAQVMERLAAEGLSYNRLHTIAPRAPAGSAGPRRDQDWSLSGRRLSCQCGWRPEVRPGNSGTRRWLP